MLGKLRTVGVDLAAQAATTAIAVIDWRPGHAQVVQVEIPADDEAVLRHASQADKVGIDCPLEACASRLQGRKEPGIAGHVGRQPARIRSVARPWQPRTSPAAQ